MSGALFAHFFICGIKRTPCRQYRRTAIFSLSDPLLRCALFRIKSRIAIL